MSIFVKNKDILRYFKMINIDYLRFDDKIKIKVNM